MATVTGSFTAAGQSSPFQIKPSTPAFNMSLWGTFVGTVQLERTFDNGTNWLPITALGTTIAFTGPCSEGFEEREGVSYRLNCTSYTSGTINYRLSQ